LKLDVNQSLRFLIESAILLHVLAQFFSIHRDRARVDSDEIRAPARLRNRFGCRNKRERDGQNNVAGLNTRSKESKAQRIGSAAYPNAKFRITELRIFSFEFVDHGTADKSRCLERSFENCDKLRLKLPVRSQQISE